MRYIIQDVYTGFIWGDSADFAGGKETPADMVEACRMLDESNGDVDYVYEEVSRLSANSGYIVYRADVGGSEAVPVVQDGQDRETIEAVEHDCQVLGYVERTRNPD